MRITYVGDSAYCYANSLAMCLRAVGTNRIPEPGFLECLTTMPFGALYLRQDDQPLLLFSSPGVTPETGLDRALTCLGWICDERRGGDPIDTIAWLREVAPRGPVLAGPVDLGCLSYAPGHQYLAGVDHCVVVLGVEDDVVRLHDPRGYPCVTIPVPDFVEAWRAEKVSYPHAPFTARTNFRTNTRRDRQAMIRAALPIIRASVAADPGGPVAFGSVRALRLAAENLRGGAPTSLAGHLVHFALPLAARHSVDASAFFEEAGIFNGAAFLEQQARWFGEAAYPARQDHWEEVARLLEQIASLHPKLISALDAAI